MITAVKKWSVCVIAAMLFAWAAVSVVPTPAEAAVKKAETTTAKKKSAAKPNQLKAKVRKKSTVRKSSKRTRRALAPVQRGSAAVDDGRERFAALVVNADTGAVLYEANAGEERHPASLTKMMTLYLLFEALKHGEVNMNSTLYVSDKAASAPPTNINLTGGDRITVRTAIESLVVRSANDSAMVVAEALGGSQEGFARKMNIKAKQLGMTATRFFNPSGLPDDRQITTAYDLARLGIALRRDFPEYYRFFSIQEFTFRGQEYEGHNRLLGRYPGADGIKTGYIRASGFNLVTSVQRGSTRLVGVVMGGRTAAVRDQMMMDMLDRTLAALPEAGRTRVGANDNLSPAQRARQGG